MFSVRCLNNCFFAVSTVAEIEAAILRLPPEAQRQLREWLLELQPVGVSEDVLIPAAYQRKIFDVLDQS